MNPTTNVFDCLLGVQWFSVTYSLYPDGKKRIMSIEYDSLPIDVVELKNSNKAANRLTYHQLCQAMDNNAMSETELKEKEVEV